MTHLNARRRYFATNQLKREIEGQGRTFRWVAGQIGISESHFNRILSGERSLSDVRAGEVARILDANFFSLFEVPHGTKKVLEGKAA